MPGTPPQDADASSQRAEDHAAIDRLADELLPALIAKLAATGLGELEVREGDWKVRLRRPATPAGKRSSERSSRGSSAHAQPSGGRHPDPGRPRPRRPRRA